MLAEIEQVNRPSSPPSATRPPRRARLQGLWVFAPAVATVLGCSLLVGRRAVWLDEAVTVYRITMPWDEWLHGSSWGSLHTQDAVHALYYVVLRAYKHLAGFDVDALRLFSALLMGLACAGVVAMVAATCGRRTAFVCGLVFALLPATADYGTEARSAALAACAGAWASFAYLRAARATRRRGLAWAAYTLLLTLTGYAFLYAWLVAGAHLLAGVVARDGRRRLGALVAAQAVSLVLMVPLVRIARGQTGQVAWIVLDVPRHLHDTVTWPFGGLAGTTTLVVSLGAWALALGVLARSARSVWADRDLTRLLVMAWAWVLVVPVTLMALSEVSHPTFVLRYLVPSLPAVAIVFGYALSRLRSRVALAAALVLCLVLDGVQTSAALDPAGRDLWGPRLEVLRQHAKRGDAVLVSPRLWEPVPVVGGMPRGVGVLHLPDDPWPAWGPHGRPVVTPEQRPRVIWLVPRKVVEPADRALVESWGYHRVRGFRVGYGGYVVEFRRVDG